MRLPGFTGEASLYMAGGHYRNSGVRMVPTGVAPSLRRLPCPRGSETAGCPRNSFCAEPGGPFEPLCRCLECAYLEGAPGTGR